MMRGVPARRLIVMMCMCMHVIIRPVRTTIEMKPEHRARVLELAAQRGEKGFSTVVAEALELYLETQGNRADAIRSALALKGSMSEAEAAGLLTQTQKIRANWR
jgi:predicted transcriptional regulator